MLSSCHLPSAFCLALGKVLFTEGLLPSTRQRACLPSIEFQALGRVYFAEGKRKNTRQRVYRMHSAEPLPSIVILLSVFWQHSTKRCLPGAQ